MIPIFYLDFGEYLDFLSKPGRWSWGRQGFVLIIFIPLAIHIVWFIYALNVWNLIKMKKILRYLVNTILFIVFWCIIYLPVMKYSIDTGSYSLPAYGGTAAIIISYIIVKRINKSNLWASLFDETDGVNEIVKETPVVKELPVKIAVIPPKKENNISELTADLTQLYELKEKGILTEEEFTEQKKKLLK